MKHIRIIICCAVIIGASYAFGASTMTHTWAVIDAAITTFLTMDTAAELENMLSLQNLQGAVTDAQVPDDITVDIATTATTATTANAGDSATAFFSSGTIESERLPSLSNLQGAVTDAQVPDDITINSENVSVTDTDENFTGTNVEAVLDELYDMKEPSQTPAGQAEMEAGTETAIRSMSPLRVAQAIAAQVDTSARTVTAHGSVSSGTEDFSPGIHTVTVSGVFAWAFTSWPASGTEGVIRAYITNGGSASFTGWGDVVWEGGVAPTLQASGLDVVTFTSLDGGTTVYGFLAGEDMQ